MKWKKEFSRNFKGANFSSNSLCPCWIPKEYEWDTGIPIDHVKILEMRWNTYVHTHVG